MTGRMRKSRPAPSRPGIQKRPPKLSPEVMEKAFSPVSDSDREEAAKALLSMARDGYWRSGFLRVPAVTYLSKPTLRERWVKFINGIGGKLLRYGR